MRAIIIEEDRFMDLTNAMKLKEHDKRSDNSAELLGVSAEVWRTALDQARREFHFEFVRWAQSHGASCVKR